MYLHTGCSFGLSKWHARIFRIAFDIHVFCNDHLHHELWTLTTKCCLICLIFSLLLCYEGPCIHDPLQYFSMDNSNFRLIKFGVELVGNLPCEKFMFFILYFDNDSAQEKIGGFRAGVQVMDGDSWMWTEWVFRIDCKSLQNFYTA